MKNWLNHLDPIKMVQVIIEHSTKLFVRWYPQLFYSFHPLGGVLLHPIWSCINNPEYSFQLSAQLSQILPYEFNKFLFDLFSFHSLVSSCCRTNDINTFRWFQYSSLFFCSNTNYVSLWCSYCKNGISTFVSL